MVGEKEEDNAREPEYYRSPTVEDLDNVIDFPKGNDPVLYFPKRVGLHWAIAYALTSCKLKIGDDKDLFRAVEQLYNHRLYQKK